MWTHVIWTASRIFGALRQLRTIRRSVPADTFQELVVSLVLSRLHYGNATLAGLEWLITELQAVMSVGARLIFNVDRREDITPLLHQLHQLRVPQRITFELATLMFQCVNGTAPG